MITNFEITKCNSNIGLDYYFQYLITGWLYRKKFIKVKNASLTIQRWARGYLARRKVFHIRRHHAAITMQRYIRGWVKRTQYLQAKDRTLRLQVCHIRGHSTTTWT